MKSYWRQKAAPIIAEVIERIGLEDLKVLKRALRDAYPFGERANHPYKMWRKEVKRQMMGGRSPIFISIEQAGTKPACVNCANYRDGRCELEGRFVREHEVCGRFIPR